MIGEIINYRYEVLEKIGDGQIFSAYKTRDKVLNRLVALKVLKDDLAANKAFAGAVRAGYQAVVPLDHPCIARVLEADPTAEEPFVGCEYVRGINVKERLQRAGTMQVSTVLDIMVPVLEALEYAHSNRIVHGDLRPQDIIVSPDGEVKVTDFGLASALRACPEVADRMGMRSVHYEAPEIAEGAAPSVSSDIYSAGVILYEMLTGSVPFDGPTAISVALKQAKDIPAAPRTLNAGVPKSLSDLVMRAIEKSPTQRFPNTGAMLDDLRSIRDALRVGKPVSVEQPTYSQHSVADPRDDDQPEGLLSRSSYVWLIIAFVIVMGIVTAVTFKVSTKDTKIEVPYLMGMTVDEAKDKARDANVTLEEDSSGIYSSDVEEGKIAQQFPAPHTKMPRDRAVVKYWLSKGPSAKKVPDLTGLAETEAYKNAEDAGFTIGKVTTEYDEKVPVNQVIRQDPEKDTLSPLKSTISLVVSLGPKPVDTSSDQGTTSEPDGNARSFQIAVTVPQDASADQEVRMVVDDSRGESTPFQETRQPGDKVSETVTGYGSRVRIRVYVGGDLVSDKTY